MQSKPSVHFDCDREVLKRDGALVIRQVFTSAEIKEVRARTLAHINTYLDPKSVEVLQPAPERVQLNRDLLSLPVLRNVVLDDRILHVARTLLGTTPVYFGMTKLVCQYEQMPLPFHRDNLDAKLGIINGPDSREDYSLIRIGMYLQDHSRHGGVLWIKPGANGTRKNRRPIPVATELGDIGVWDMRAEHGVSTFAPTSFGGRKFPEVLESAWVKVQRPFVPYAKRRLKEPRIFLHIVFGREDLHLERFVKNVPTVESYRWIYNMWKRSHYDDQVWEAVRGKDVIVKDMQRRMGP
jgi:hypothetical protein